ncbi:MAG: hypothetical protein P4L46_11615 [Fimbriimonas sp.]|nr:hypothetical protein [Fimbriimonas sp.]
MRHSETTKPGNRHSTGTTLVTGALLVSASLLVVVLGGCGGGGIQGSAYGTSVEHLVAVDKGLLLYANDYDNVLPETNTWMDALAPYTRDEGLYHSPAVAIGQYGYAMNASIVGHSATAFSDPATVETLFDSTDLRRNATDPTSTEPRPARYGTRNTIAYLDGHVQDQSTVPGASSPFAQSQAHLAAIDAGMLMYSNDYDDVLPLAGNWEDGMLPYVKTEANFHSPAVVKKNPSDYGYAFNSTIAGQPQTSIVTPATTISFFDSTDLTRNATASTATLPKPPRYGSKNTIAYADGHVQK